MRPLSSVIFTLQVDSLVNSLGVVHPYSRYVVVFPSESHTTLRVVTLPALAVL